MNFYYWFIQFNDLVRLLTCIREQQKFGGLSSSHNCINGQHKSSLLSKVVNCINEQQKFREVSNYQISINGQYNETRF